MNEKVSEFIKMAQIRERRQKQEERDNVLIKLGLVDLEEMPSGTSFSQSDSDIERKYIPEKHAFVLYKRRPINISEEEFNEVLKYKYLFPEKFAELDSTKSSVIEEASSRTSEIEDNGESSFRNIAKIQLYICNSFAVILLLFGLYFLFNCFLVIASEFIFGAIFIALYGYVIYWGVQIFTNISLKVSAIYESNRK